MNIKAKGMLLSFIMILAATLVIGMGAYYHFKSILLNEVNSAVVRVAEESADHLNHYITQYLTPLVGLSENEEIESMDWTKQKSVICAQIYPQYQNVAVVDLSGTAYYIDDSVLDLSDRNYIEKALKGKVSFSEVIISRKTGAPVIMVGVPIYRDKEIQGALIARLDVGFLSDYAQTRGYGDNGRAYIISEEGTLISRPDYASSGEEYNLYKIAETQEDYQSFAEFVKTGSSKQTGYGEYEYNHEKILMGYALIKETNWKIYIGTNEDDISKGLFGLKQIIVILIVISLIVCTLSAWILIDRFFRPLVELDDLFSRGARGDLTIRFIPKTKDEIGRLGNSFNRMMDKIKTLTRYDPLTGLSNQYVFDMDMKELLQSCKEKDFTLIMVAIDRLSFINDTYGYFFGDEIIIQVSKRISAWAEQQEQVYRYKGDEFVILCTDNFEESEFLARTQKLLEELLKSYQVNSKTADIHISIGAFTRNEDTKQEDPLKSVTQAKNYAKTLGGNQIQKFDQQIHNKIKLNKELQADILNGLKQNQFFLVYQPLFHLENESIAELEALIRWNHPEWGLLYPDKFIELAEASGAIINIDMWVMESACRLLKSRKDDNKPPVMLSVNISARTFETKEFIPDLLDIIHRYAVDPAMLQLEITERMLINNIEEGIYKLNELRGMGIKVAIDDFGIGYSSLSYIVRLPIDSIKIDKSFVQNMTSSEEAKVIVSTIISLCKTLRLNVIAEGIERKIELDYLKSNKCDIGQGYYFSKPVSITEIETKHFI